MDINQLRTDFPFLEHHQGLIYLDNAASTQKPRVVLDAMREFYERSYANVHRGAYRLSVDASTRYEDARKQVKTFFNAEEAVFVRNATEALNLAAYGLTQSLSPGDSILISEMEHHANLVPWQQLSKRYGFKLLYTSITPDGYLDLGHYSELLREKPKIVALSHCSNVLGTINPVAELCRAAKEIGAVTVIDGAQAAPHLSVDLNAIGCDLYAVSSHKMLGPTGVGALLGTQKTFLSLPPFNFGGDMIETVTKTDSTFNTVPHRFEAGTPDAAGVIGFAAALGYLQSQTMAEVRSHEVALTSLALQLLSEIPSLSVYGPKNAEDKSGAIAFNLTGVHPHDLSGYLDSFKICVRSGNHCAQPLMTALGIPYSCRASFYLYNTESEVRLLAEKILEAKRFFGA